MNGCEKPHGRRLSLDDRIALQNAFDARMAVVRCEGAMAYRNGIPQGQNPYEKASKPNEYQTWRGGWAEAYLGIYGE